MSTVAAIEAARAAGIELEIDGDDLVLTANEPPPANVLDLLSRHKTDILAHLARKPDGWSGMDWRLFFDERAGIAEFDGRQSHDHAEARAFSCCVNEWLNRNPMTSPPDRCLGCGDGGTAYDPLLPFGGQSTGHTWLHGRCWPAWHTLRQKEAVAALAAMGISAPAPRKIGEK